MLGGLWVIDDGWWVKGGYLILLIIWDRAISDVRCLVIRIQFHRASILFFGQLLILLVPTISRIPTPSARCAGSEPSTVLAGAQRK